MMEPALAAVEGAAAGARESAMIGTGRLHDDRAGGGMRIASRGSDRPSPTVAGIFGDPLARIITLTRRSKNRLVSVRADPVRVVRPPATWRTRSRLTSPSSRASTGHRDLPACCRRSDRVGIPTGV
jgi:hypothetical protein